MSRHPLRLLLVTVLSLVILSGCSDDLRHRNVFDGGAGDAVITFSVENIALSRSVSDIESGIEHAYLLFYDSGVNPESAELIAAVRALVSESAPSTLTFKMPKGLDPDTDYRLVAVANADDFVPEGFGSFKDYVESWCHDTSPDRQPLSLFHSDPLVGNAVVSLPMNGRTVDDVPFRFSVKDGGYKVSASLSFRRDVARIDVANIVKNGFVVEEVALCNWRDAVAVSSADGHLGNRLGSVRGILSAGYEDEAGVFFVEMPAADGDGIQQLRQSIYCFPAVSYDSYPSDRESTSLIIKARYGEDSESSYYRVNVGLSGNKSEVKANTKYLVTIQSVKGSGAATPEEAYAAEESQIALSVVEDWDLDGSFAMDDNGNFIVLSTGHLEFEGEDVSNREVRVLTSKGLTWTVAYVADNDASASAFTATKLSDKSLAIGTTGRNDGEDALSGKFVVSTTTIDGGKLSIDIQVGQTPAKTSDDPSIPEDMPFALVPLWTDRVKIDHEARTIEIDGFDPDCFNSFIDIPFKLYIRPERDISSVNVSSSLLWPLEGRIALGPSRFYTYCYESFDSQGMGKVVDSSGEKKEFSSLFSSSLTLKEDGEIIYISVGAMGPDDPAIVRDVSLSSLNEGMLTYRLTVAPCEAIIDDVIVIDDEGNQWMVMDRNVQETGYYYPLLKYVGRDTNGEKRQAYNYSSGPGPLMSIPFKFSTENVSFSEDKHTLYMGYIINYRLMTNSTSGIVSNRKAWLNRYRYSDDEAPSPQFYNVDSIHSWVFPTKEMIETCCEKMRVSKMRMYLVSDVSAVNEDRVIPICCYWPYKYNYDMTADSNGYRYGYFVSGSSETMETPASIIYTFYNGGNVNAYEWSVFSDDIGLTRLVRPLHDEELEDYKTNYLGYGSGPCRLRICHPDTYESTSLGWLPD